MQIIHAPPWYCRTQPSSTRGHSLPLMTRVRGYLVAPIWNWSVKFWMMTSRRAVSDRIFARGGSGRDTGRQFGQSYIHMRPSGTRLIDKSKRPSNTMLRTLVQGRGVRTSERASSKHVLMSSRLTLVSYPNSSTCAIAMQPMLWWKCRSLVIWTWNQGLLPLSDGCIRST